jgi:hypothetical protein
MRVWINTHEVDSVTPLYLYNKTVSGNFQFTRDVTASEIESHNEILFFFLKH